MAPVTRPLRKPLHHVHTGPHSHVHTHSLTTAAHSRGHTNFRAEMAQHLASNAPNQADPNDDRGFKGNQTRLKKDEERRREIYRKHLLNLIKARRNR